MAKGRAMSPAAPPSPPSNRVNEESLQLTFEAMLAEIQRMKLIATDEKKLIGMLLKYRSAWNSYISTFKPRQSRAALNSERKKKV